MEGPRDGFGKETQSMLRRRKSQRSWNSSSASLKTPERFGGVRQKGQSAHSTRSGAESGAVRSPAGLSRRPRCCGRGAQPPPRPALRFKDCCSTVAYQSEGARQLRARVRFWISWVSTLTSFKPLSHQNVGPAFCGDRTVDPDPQGESRFWITSEKGRCRPRD